MNKIIFEIDEKLKLKLQIKLVKNGLTIKNVLTEMIEKYVGE